MLTTLYAAKGGQGTTVTAAALALIAARTQRTLLIDAAGDLPAVLGIPEPSGPGLGELIEAIHADKADPEHIDNATVEITPKLRLLHRGKGELHQASVSAVVEYLRTRDMPVIVDAGTVTDTSPSIRFVIDPHKAILVTRACYIALKRAVALQTPSPAGIILIEEPGRALGALDVEDVIGAPIAGRVAETLGAPVMATVPRSAATARAVDAGMLSFRLPKELDRPLTELVEGKGGKEKNPCGN